MRLGFLSECLDGVTLKGWNISTLPSQPGPQETWESMLLPLSKVLFFKKNPICLIDRSALRERLEINEYLSTLKRIQCLCKVWESWNRVVVLKVLIKNESVRWDYGTSETKVMDFMHLISGVLFLKV